jgi:predicted ATP-grasp superfamily ATP-dependent carboligase
MKNYNITCYADLEREERRVKGRLRKQEEEIAKRVKQLPEEILIAGITKVISSIINGTFMKSGMSVLRSVGSHFFNNSSEEGTEGKKKGFKGIIMDVLKGYFNKDFSA